MLDTFKFVDDVTMIEIVEQSANSQMQIASDQIAAWSRPNFMNIIAKKTKEMLLGPIKLNPPPSIVINNSPVERVLTFKLLGIVISNNLCWDDHVSTIYEKANRRLHYLKLLKRSSVTVHDLMQFYKSVIRPVVEYACPLWINP
jgi:hypothetical protein